MDNVNEENKRFCEENLSMQNAWYQKKIRVHVRHGNRWGMSTGNFGEEMKKTLGGS